MRIIEIDGSVNVSSADNEEDNEANLERGLQTRSIIQVGETFIVLRLLRDILATRLQIPYLFHDRMAELEKSVHTCSHEEKILKRITDLYVECKK